MPFNPSGIFQRLYNWVADRDASIKIEAERMDAEFVNYADGINAILAGDQPFRAPVRFPFGSAAAPGMAFEGDTDNGLYRSGTNTVAVSAGGAGRFLVGAGSITNTVPMRSIAGTTSDPAYSFSTDPNTGIYSPGADAISVIVGGGTASYNAIDLSNDGLSLEKGLFESPTAVQQSKTDVTSGRLMRADFGYSPGNILGSVYDTLGVPGGAIIETFTGANGTFIRYADGTQICFNRAIESVATDTASGALFTSPAVTTWTYPMAFVSTPIVVARATGGSSRWAVVATESASGATLRAMGSISNATALPIGAVAFGRWK